MPRKSEHKIDLIKLRRAPRSGSSVYLGFPLAPNTMAGVRDSTGLSQRDEAFKYPPFVVGVLADCSGNVPATPPPCESRNFAFVHGAKLRDLFDAIKPRLTVHVPNLIQTGGADLQVTLRFERMEDFSPWAVANAIPALRDLIHARGRLASLIALPEKPALTEEFIAMAKAALETHAERVPDHAAPAPIEVCQPSQASRESPSLLEQIVQYETLPANRDRVDRDRQLVDLLAVLLTSNIMPPHGVKDAIERMISEIDLIISRQVRAIIHQSEFQQLEGTWRGLELLANSADRAVEIAVMQISKHELEQEALRFADASACSSSLYEAFGRRFVRDQCNPIGCLIGDFLFEQNAEDLLTVRFLAQIAQAALVPLITGAASSFLGPPPADGPAALRTQGCAGANEARDRWKLFRRTDEAKYVSLAAPRYLAREPFTNQPTAPESFRFVEDAPTQDHSLFTWANSAYLIVAQIIRSFVWDGWFTRIGQFHADEQWEGLSSGATTGELGRRLCPEVKVSEEDERRLAASGLNALVKINGRGAAVFRGLRTLHTPAETSHGGAVRPILHSQSLAEMLVASHFGRLARCMLNEWNTAGNDTRTLQRVLQDWMTTLVIASPDAAEVEQQMRPLCEARCSVTSLREHPPVFRIGLSIRVHRGFEYYPDILVEFEQSLIPTG